MPKQKHISPKDVCNIRVQAKVLMREVHAKGNEIYLFEYDFQTIKCLLRGMDNETSYYIDKAITTVKTIYQQYMNVDGNRIKFIALLENI